MPIFKKKSRESAMDSAKVAGTIIGSAASQNSQNATNAAIDGMNLFRWKVDTAIIKNGHFEAQKGNLFEYIEAAKFNVDAASKRSSAKAIVTDYTDPSANADIIIQDSGKTVKEIQAKFINTSSNGRNVSARDSVFDQTGANNKGWGQYDGMDRLIRKQDNYNSEGSLLDEAKKLAKSRYESNNIHAETYKDVYEKLTDETHYQEASSGGTTIEEVKKAYDRPKTYANKFERKQVAKEMKCSAANMARASFVTTGILSSITNMIDVFQNKKALSKALADVTSDAIKSGVRGAATGVVSTAIRYRGIKKGSTLLSDSTAATIMAGGIIDGGVALYSYALGDINEKELRDQLVDTTAKTTATIYFTKAIKAILGKSVSPIVPMVIYTTASYVVTCTREIIQNAKLKIEEYERMVALLQESTRQMNEYQEILNTSISKCEENQRLMFNRFMESFDYNLETGENYDQAVSAIVSFANEAGIVLQHTDFNDFKKAMKSNEPFVLK